jgi:cellulose synthase/poly-beta-1,6-N-acetylglucosamine synthase-like glycosyltransferase
MAFTLLLSIIYIIQLFVSLVRVHRNYDKTFSDDFHSYVDSDNLLPISLIIPAYNEQEHIVQNIRSLLTINYPMFEIIVVNDGSTDRTGENVIEAFKMHKIETSIRYRIPTQKIDAVYYSKQYPNLLYVQKQNGGKSDALNAGINISRYPLFTCLDADSRIEKDALLRLSMEVLTQQQHYAMCYGCMLLFVMIMLFNALCAQRRKA